MEVMLVIGLATICDKEDMENLSRKRFSNFESLDRHLEASRKVTASSISWILPCLWTIGTTRMMTGIV